jgi:predicted Zn-dependent protease
MWNRLSPIRILQALALFDEKSSLEYGLALWAAFHEIEAFYLMGGTKIEYRRFYIAPSVPTIGRTEDLPHRLAGALPGVQVVRASERLSQDEIVSSVAPSRELANSARRTYDRQKLASVIRKLIDPKKSDSHLMIVTDRIITPPPKYRYIIWEQDLNANASVISVAPLDPQYWRDNTPDRVMMIKRRMRNVALSLTGRLIGLENCENESCFLYDNVDSVTALDEMRELGKEHGDVRSLNGMGFNDNIEDPTTLQPVVHHPATRRAAL